MYLLSRIQVLGFWRVQVSKIYDAISSSVPGEMTKRLAGGVPESAKTAARQGLHKVGRSEKLRFCDSASSVFSAETQQDS